MFHGERPLQWLSVASKGDGYADSVGVETVVAHRPMGMGMGMVLLLLLIRRSAWLS